MTTSVDIKNRNEGKCTMKKENRKMAQERRAKERRKKELKRKISKIIVIVLPLIAVIALIIAIIVTSDSSDNSSGSDNTTTESDSGTDDTSGEDASDSGSTDDASSYSTDTSLTIKDGDTVNIDYVGSIDGVEFAGGSTQGQGTDLVIGSGSYIDDFEDQLIGAHPGDNVEVTVTFPEDYGNEELNGKEAVFDVTVNGIYQ